ncbi:MAG: sulfatase/phosphatase domain-containing protein [Phycisphaerae bacterium]
MRLPCIAWCPGAVPAGVECNEIATAMDFLPTFVKLAGGTVPEGRPIDGKDITPLLLQEDGARSPHQEFCYFHRGSLDAVRKGPWKLHFRKKQQEVQELYDLREDVGETTNLYQQHPEVVQELTEIAGRYRAELGDAAMGIEGTGRRPVGRVEDNRTLTRFDPSHPYFAAEYDLGEGG